MIDDFRPVLGSSVPPEVTVGFDVIAEAWVRGSRVALEQVLLNLVINAGEAIGGTGSIVVRVTPAAQKPDFYCLEVADDGQGMTQETLSRIFEPFFTTKAETGGHGLGLAGVYATVTGIGGELAVHSEAGEGTVFQLLLPCGQAEAILTSTCLLYTSDAADE